MGKIGESDKNRKRIWMKNTVLIVGEKFRYQNDFLEYLKREISAKLPKIDAFLFVRENDPNIIGELESQITQSSNIIIASSKANFTLIGKMLSTHLRDTLVPRGSMLIPSKCKEYTEGSYLVNIQSKAINVLRIELFCAMPPILIEEKTKLKKAFLLDDDEESAKLLISPIATACDIAVLSYKNPSGFIEIVAEEKKYGKIDNFMQKLTRLFEQKIVVAESLEEYLIDALRAKSKKIAVAESCSGGLLSYKFVRTPGASDVFIGSLTTYANEAKFSWLNVDEATIVKYGAVSEQTISQMLDGTLRISGADYVAAISGVAGPGGGSIEKPVGTVYIGVKNRSGISKIEKKVFFGDRTLIQSASAGYALKMLCEIF